MAFIRKVFRLPLLFVAWCIIKAVACLKYLFPRVGKRVEQQAEQRRQAKRKVPEVPTHSDDDNSGVQERLETLSTQVSLLLAKFAQLEKQLRVPSQ